MSHNHKIRDYQKSLWRITNCPPITLTAGSPLPRIYPETLRRPADTGRLFLKINYLIQKLDLAWRYAILNSGRWRPMMDRDATVTAPLEGSINTHPVVQTLTILDISEEEAILWDQIAGLSETQK